MSSILNAVKGKVNKLKQNGMLRICLISAFALLLIVSVTLAWYINNVGLYGMEFSIYDETPRWRGQSVRLVKDI